MSNPIDVVKGVFAAYESKDRGALERLIDTDFRFLSPLDNGLNRQRYFEICWPNSRTIERFDLQSLAQDGERVFVTYEAIVQGGKRLRNTEVLTVRGGRVIQVEVYFGWNVPHAVKPGEHSDSPS
jgi:ketosteroid isomerase-like protein